MRNKSVILSIHPFFCEKIEVGEKLLEIRKNKPNIELPFKCYIYETKAINHKKIIVDLDGELPTTYARGRGKVIGEFICDRIEYLDMDSIGVGFWENGEFIYLKDIGWNACLTRNEFIEYSNGKKLYGWHISELKIYDKPKPLSDFYSYKHLINDSLPCDTGKCEYDYFDSAENCGACRLDFDGKTCPKIMMNRPPQSWCYVLPLAKTNSI